MDLLEEYIKSGRIKLNTHKYHETYTVHDPCNYVRKSQLAFGQSTADQSRWIAQQCIDPSLFREMCEDSMNNLCCGAGGGAWAMPYDEERLGLRQYEGRPDQGHRRRDRYRPVPQLPGPDHERPPQALRHGQQLQRDPVPVGTGVPVPGLTSPGAKRRSKRATPPATPSLSGTASSWTKRNKPAA